MKTLVIIFSMLAIIAFNSYGQDADIKGLLEKPETRTEIFNTILENHELMMEFMKNMKGNEHAMMMMEEDSKMMEMCAQDSAMCCNMANMMTENPEMKQKGMMGMKGCMQMKHKKDDNKQEHKH